MAKNDVSVDHHLLNMLVLEGTGGISGMKYLSDGSVLAEKRADKVVVVMFEVTLFSCLFSFPPYFHAFIKQEKQRMSAEELISDAHPKEHPPW
jgi:hypothetical protein